MSRPQARVDGVLEELVVHRLVPILTDPSGSPLLCGFDSIGLLTRDEKMRVPAGGVVQDELASRVFGGGEGLDHV